MSSRALLPSTRLLDHGPRYYTSEIARYFLMYFLTTRNQRLTTCFCLAMQYKRIKDLTRRNGFAKSAPHEAGQRNDMLPG